MRSGPTAVALVAAALSAAATVHAAGTPVAVQAFEAPAALAIFAPEVTRAVDEGLQQAGIEVAPAVAGAPLVIAGRIEAQGDDRVRLWATVTGRSAEAEGPLEEIDRLARELVARLVPLLPAPTRHALPGGRGAVAHVRRGAAPQPGDAVDPAGAPPSLPTLRAPTPPAAPPGSSPPAPSAASTRAAAPPAATEPAAPTPAPPVATPPAAPVIAPPAVAPPEAPAPVAGRERAAAGPGTPPGAAAGPGPAVATGGAGVAPPVPAAPPSAPAAPAASAPPASTDRAPTPAPPSEIYEPLPARPLRRAVVRGGLAPSSARALLHTVRTPEGCAAGEWATGAAREVLERAQLPVVVGGCGIVAPATAMAEAARAGVGAVVMATVESLRFDPIPGELAVRPTGRLRVVVLRDGQAVLVRTLDLATPPLASPDTARAAYEVTEAGFRRLAGALQAVLAEAR